MNIQSRFGKKDSWVKLLTPGGTFDRSYNSGVPRIDADCFVCVALFTRAVSRLYSTLCLILPIVWKNSIYFCKKISRTPCCSYSQ